MDAKKAAELLAAAEQGIAAAKKRLKERKKGEALGMEWAHYLSHAVQAPQPRFALGWKGCNGSGAGQGSRASRWTRQVAGATPPQRRTRRNSARALDSAAAMHEATYRSPIDRASKASHSAELARFF